MEPIKTHDVWINTGNDDLEKKSDMVVMTVHEFKKAINKAMDDTWIDRRRWVGDIDVYDKYKTEYINQLIQP